MLPRQAYSLLQKLGEHTPHGTPVSEVLMFHDVYPDGTQPRESDIAVSLHRFRAFAGALEPAAVGTPEDLRRPGAVLLTFDDIFDSAFRSALPVLRDFGLPYTVFIAPGLLGQRGYITAEQLRELTHDPLCTIGSHTMTHPLMRPLSREACLAELTESKHWLEDFCGREVPYFAFPYGSLYACSRENIGLVPQAGYRLGFSTVRRGVRPGDLAEPWFLPRVNMNDSVLQRKGF